ncbi:MAG: heavy-metal-associated domain-containing protein [Bacteroidales bacterium]
MKTETMIVNNMKCTGCVNTVKAGLSNIQGVDKVEADLPSSSVTVSYNDESVRSTIIKKLEILGYSVKR